MQEFFELSPYFVKSLPDWNDVAEIDKQKAQSTWLDYAISMGDFETTVSILQLRPAWINEFKMYDVGGYFIPLSAAVVCNSVKIVEWLLDHGADAITSSVPLWWVATTIRLKSRSYGYQVQLKIGKLLLEHGALPGQHAFDYCLSTPQDEFFAENGGNLVDFILSNQCDSDQVVDLIDIHLNFKSRFEALNCDPSDYAYALLDDEYAHTILAYANDYPEKLDWRTFLRNEFRTESKRNGHYLNALTLYPGHGLFLEEELLKLTDSIDYDIRGWAMEVLGFWMRDHYYLPVNTDVLVKTLRKRLTDDFQDLRETAQDFLDLIEAAHQFKLQLACPQSPSDV